MQCPPSGLLSLSQGLPGGAPPQFRPPAPCCSWLQGLLFPWRGAWDSAPDAPWGVPLAVLQGGTLLKDGEARVPVGSRASGVSF